MGSNNDPSQASTAQTQDIAAAVLARACRGILGSVEHTALVVIAAHGLPSYAL